MSDTPEELRTWRVVAVVESEYVEEVEARTAADAAVALGDRIRAGTITATHGPFISSVEASVIRDPDLRFPPLEAY